MIYRSEPRNPERSSPASPSPIEDPMGCFAGSPASTLPGSSVHFGIFRTQLAYLGTRLLSTPCWCLLTMLAYILYKNLHLTPLQIAFIVAIKPASSLLSPYWTQWIHGKPEKMVTYLAAANFFRYIPFLFVPWISSPWFFIAAFGFYMMLSRATIPAWMELFRVHLPAKTPEKMVAYGTTIEYLGTALLAVGAGLLLDYFEPLWPWLFFVAALLGAISTLFFLSVPSSPIQQSKERQLPKLFTPWKQVWQLIRQHKEFTIFQMGFMLGGAGLMLMQPALPPFFIDTLHLSFTEMGIALALCKGIGVAATSSFWTQLFRRWNIFQLSALVTFFATLFPFLLLASFFHLSWIYIAYIFYGIMQSGSELSWHMSSLVFAKEKDSSLFSVTNILTVGLRGCLIPALGSLLLSPLHPLGVILLGASFCLLASITFLYSKSKIVPSQNF